MSTLDRLRAIANRAGAPTMDYAPDYVIVEQRNSLDWIAHEAAEAIRELLLIPSRPASGRCPGAGVKKTQF